MAKMAYWYLNDHPESKDRIMAGVADGPQVELPDPDVAGWDACMEWYYTTGEPQHMTLKELALKIHKGYGYVRQQASLYKHT